VSQKVADERGFPSIDLDRPTLAFWVGYAAAELMPLTTTFCAPPRLLESGGSQSLLATAFSERASARARARTRPRDQVIGRRDNEPLVGQLAIDVGEKRIDASASRAARGNQLAVRHYGCASAYFHLSAHPCALRATALRQRGSRARLGSVRCA
jgi:hypothetical protein